MNLSEEQVTTLKQKAAEGGQLNDLQKMIQNDFGKNITYMETRFLISDLGIEILTEETPTDTKTDENIASPASEPPLPAEGDSIGVTVSVDEIARPGAVVNGQVTWSDGQTASWIIDQAGGLAMDSSDPTYQPSQNDIEEFQLKLRQILGA